VIKYNKFVLNNGLRVVHQQDSSVSNVVLNTLYNVGARDEDPTRTGFAHLFEHLMFGGSLNVPSFDAAIENAGGQNNAFTTNEITNYYISVPLENVETAFWLESDRMLALNVNPKSLSVQQGVVIEEFKQRCFNAPFGKLWHHIRELLYTESPYRWPTIGKEISHVEDATLSDVQSFYNQFYIPQNAIVSVVGDLSLEETKSLCEKWFEPIHKNGNLNANQYVVDVPQKERRFLETTDLSPNPAVFLVWKGPSYSEAGSLELDIFADLLGGSEVSDLQQVLVKEKQICNAAECFYLRGLNEGLFLLYGILNDDVSHEIVENELLETMKNFHFKR
jgi:zinc protease